MNCIAHKNDIRRKCRSGCSLFSNIPVFNFIFYMIQNTLCYKICKGILSKKREHIIILMFQNIVSSDR